jgi:carbon storage regulator CsrA
VRNSLLFFANFFLISSGNTRRNGQNHFAVFRQAGTNGHPGPSERRGIMLYLTLVEGDYAVINGNVKVLVERIDGKDRVFIGIDAPKDVPVMRSQIYEREIAEQAALTGDKALAEVSAGLEKERMERRRRYNQRQKSRAEYERRIASGEIPPCAAPELKQNAERREQAAGE